jgi:hypothetical protein
MDRGGLGGKPTIMTRQPVRHYNKDAHHRQRTSGEAISVTWAWRTVIYVREEMNHADRSDGLAVGWTSRSGRPSRGASDSDRRSVIWLNVRQRRRQNLLPV